MNPQTNYEQARDEAAEVVKVYSQGLSPHQKEIWIDGADFGRSYEQKANADLIADCKAMYSALNEVQKQLEIFNFAKDVYRVIKSDDIIVKTITKLNGKYDE